MFVTSREDVRVRVKTGQKDVAIVNKKSIFFIVISLNVSILGNGFHAASTAGWRMVIFPCGMPACITLRGTPNSPKGGLVLLCINVFFSAHRHFSLFGQQVFSRDLGSGARREPTRTPRRKCGPWPRSVARALGVQSRT